MRWAALAAGVLVADAVLIAVLDYRATHRYLAGQQGWA